MQKMPKTGYCMFGSRQSAGNAKNRLLLVLSHDRRFMVMIEFFFTGLGRDRAS